MERLCPRKMEEAKEFERGWNIILSVDEDIMADHDFLGA